MDWTHYLPPTLQIPDIYFAMAVSLAVVCACRTLPIQFRQPWLIQLITLVVACATLFGLWGEKSLVYSFGTGWICSSIATSFYDLFFSFIETKVRSFLGVPNPPVEPLQYNPLPPPPPPPTTPILKP